ncbi:MAG: hypothetical protein HYS38_06990 [Acidobacteria bacterium]|nr:hypothetical protein [Acidobacteriota bacterium]
MPALGFFLHQRAPLWACCIAILASSDAFAQAPAGGARGYVVIDSMTQKAVGDFYPKMSPIRIEPVFAKGKEKAADILNSHGIVPDVTVVDSFKRMNAAGFEGDKAKSNAVLFVPMFQSDSLSYSGRRYSLKFSEPALAQIQLKNDALALARFSDGFKALPATNSQEKESFLRGANILARVSGNMTKLGEGFAANLTGSELATISFQAELIAHLARDTEVRKRAPDAATLKLMEESESFLVNVLKSSTSSNADVRTGKKVTIIYGLPGKPVMGLRLYAVPLGMKYFPTRYLLEHVERAIGNGAFDQLTSPSSKHLPWGNYAIVAGPPKVTKAFLEKFVKDQDKLDIMTIAVTTTRDDDSKITILALNPKQ